jgi:Ca2+-binding RTX toxin-like protein
MTRAMSRPAVRRPCERVRRDPDPPDSERVRAPATPILRVMRVTSTSGKPFDATRNPRWLSSLVVAGAVALALAHGAAAATVSVSGRTVVYEASVGEANVLAAHVSSHFEGDEETASVTAVVTVTDAGASITPGPGCESTGPNSAACDLPDIGFGETLSFVAHLGDGNDRASTSGCNDPDEGPRCEYTLDGGDGDDALLGGAVDQTHRLFGGSGADSLDGGIGSASAWLDGGPGPDTLTNGNAIYRDRVAPVFVTLNGLRDDGEQGENDLVRDDVDLVEGGAGDDVLVGNARGNYLTGGGGIYFLRGGSGNDWIWGEADCEPGTIAEGGADRIWGQAGSDSLFGCGGDDGVVGGRGGDSLRGDAGADRLRGGDGRDRANYWERTAPLSVSIDLEQNDGEIGENDLVAPDVEDVSGGHGDDVLVGSAVANLLLAGPGSDVVRAGGGNDRIWGGDWCWGTDGDDRLSGGNGNDVVTGCRGDDVLRGGRGRDWLAGRGDDDTFYTRDGQRDRLYGGQGTDRARLDRGLDARRSVEVVS